MPSRSSADRIVYARGVNKSGPAVAPIVSNMQTAREIEVRPPEGVVTPGVQNIASRPAAGILVIDQPTDDIPPT